MQQKMSGCCHDPVLGKEIKTWHNQPDRLSCPSFGYCFLPLSGTGERDAELFVPCGEASQHFRIRVVLLSSLLIPPFLLPSKLKL